MANIRLTGLVSLAVLALVRGAMAQRVADAPPGPKGSDIGVVQKLDGQIPLDSTWKDEFGKDVTLREFYAKGKPVLFIPVFYGCKGICLVTMDGVMKAVTNIKSYDIGRDYEIVTFSIHPKETPDMARGMKETALMAYGRPGAEGGWHFLTGSESSIHELTNALGFRYTYDPKTNWIDHPAAIMVTTPEGRISQYFIDVNYVPTRVYAALKDAAAQKIGDVTDPVWFGCLNRNRATGAISVNVNRIVQAGAVLTFLILSTSIFVMTRKYRTTALHTDKKGSNPL